MTGRPAKNWNLSGGRGEDEQLLKVFKKRSKGYDVSENEYQNMIVRFRCSTYIYWARLYCRELPKPYNGLNVGCYDHLELVQDCPKKDLEGLPPQHPKFVSSLSPPFVRSEVVACRVMKQRLAKCREEYTNYDADWKCVPFQGFVDQCIAQKWNK